MPSRPTHNSFGQLTKVANKCQNRTRTNDAKLYETTLSLWRTRRTEFTAFSILNGRIYILNCWWPSFHPWRLVFCFILYYLFSAQEVTSADLYRCEQTERQFEWIYINQLTENKLKYNKHKTYNLPPPEKQARHSSAVCFVIPTIVSIVLKQGG